MHFITKSAFSKARKKLKHTIFVELLEKLNNFFYENNDVKKWNGFNLKAIDGTTIYLPQNDATIKHFGTLKNISKKYPAMARVSQIFDCHNKITTNAIILPIRYSELEAFAIQADSLVPEDLLLMDRNYPAFWIFSHLKQMNVSFCARVSTNKYNVIKDFYLSDKRDEIIEIGPSNIKWKDYVPEDISRKPVKLRAIKIELDTGETEILLTTLTDKEKYKTEIFKDLYHLRWPIEEDYKILKKRVEVENFSGRTVESVYQDFYAKIFTKNLAAILSFGLDDIIDEECRKQKRKYKYKLNTTNVLAKLKGIIVLLLTRNHHRYLLEDFRSLICNEIEPVRPGRKYKREKRWPVRFYPQYKSIS